MHDKYASAFALQDNDSLAHVWKHLREAALRALDKPTIEGFGSVLAEYVSGDTPEDLREQAAMSHAMYECLHPDVVWVLVRGPLRVLGRLDVFENAYECGVWSMKGHEHAQALLSERLVPVSGDGAARYLLIIGAGHPAVIPGFQLRAGWSPTRSDLFDYPDYPGTVSSSCSLTHFPVPPRGQYWDAVAAPNCLFSDYASETFLAAIRTLRIGGPIIITYPACFATKASFVEIETFAQHLAGQGFGTLQLLEADTSRALIFTMQKLAGLPRAPPTLAAGRGKLTIKVTDTRGRVISVNAVAFGAASSVEKNATGLYLAAMNLPSMGSGSRTWLDKNTSERLEKGWATSASAVMCPDLLLYTGSADTSGVEARSGTQLKGGSNKLLEAVLQHHEKHKQLPGRAAFALLLTSENPYVLLQALAGPGPVTAALRKFVSRSLERITVQLLYRSATHAANLTRSTYVGGADISSMGGKVRFVAVCTFAASTHFASCPGLRRRRARAPDR